MKLIGFLIALFPVCLSNENAVAMWKSAFIQTFVAVKVVVPWNLVDVTSATVFNQLYFCLVRSRSVKSDVSGRLDLSGETRRKSTVHWAIVLSHGYRSVFFWVTALCLLTDWLSLCFIASMPRRQPNCPKSSKLCLGNKRVLRSLTLWHFVHCTEHKFLLFV